MALTEGVGPVTSSYIDSMCMHVIPSLLFDHGSRAALIFPLFFLKIIAITVVKTTILTIKAVASELIYIVCTVLIIYVMKQIENVSIYVYSDGVTSVSCDFPACICNNLYSKCALAAIRGYFGTSDSGVVGGSGAAATV